MARKNFQMRQGTGGPQQRLFFRRATASLFRKKRQKLPESFCRIEPILKTYNRCRTKPKWSKKHPKTASLTCGFRKNNRFPVLCPRFKRNRRENEPCGRFRFALRPTDMRRFPPAGIINCRSTAFTEKQKHIFAGRQSFRLNHPPVLYFFF